MKIALIDPSIFIRIGFTLIAISLGLAVIFFYPVLIQEARYLFRSSSGGDVEVVVEESPEGSDTVVKEGKKKIEPVDKEFGIVIPKINANASVVKDVDYQDPKEYQRALTKGVAHAEGTKLPGQFGNVFIFSHSSVNFYEARRFNSIFYLLHKLEAEDKFYLIYAGEVFEYKVTEKKIVAADAVKYLGNRGGKKTATLMTCWPPGTTHRRLIVISELVNVD
ncbi:MAG: sortase [Patescibacteria group bacterium]